MEAKSNLCRLPLPRVPPADRDLSVLSGWAVWAEAHRLCHFLPPLVHCSLLYHVSLSVSRVWSDHSHQLTTAVFSPILKQNNEISLTSTFFTCYQPLYVSSPLYSEVTSNCLYFAHFSVTLLSWHHSAQIWLSSLHANCIYWCHHGPPLC